LRVKAQTTPRKETLLVARPLGTMRGGAKALDAILVILICASCCFSYSLPDSDQPKVRCALVRTA
jgi:hypothetical protein